MLAWATDQSSKVGHVFKFQDTPLLGSGAYLALGKILAGLLKLAELPSFKSDAGLSAEQHQANAAALLQAFSANDIPVSSCSADDVAKGDVNRITGLVWSLVLFWQNPSCVKSIPSDPLTTPNPDSDLTKLSLLVKQELLRWAADELRPDYPAIPCTSFRTSFLDGRVLCALIHKRLPDLFPKDALARPSQDTASAALAAAASRLAVPQLFSGEDLLSKPEEYGLVAYLAHLRLQSAPPSAAAPAAQRSLDLDSRLEQMRSRIRAKYNGPDAGAASTPDAASQSITTSTATTATTTTTTTTQASAFNPTMHSSSSSSPSSSPSHSSFSPASIPARQHSGDSGVSQEESVRMQHELSSLRAQLNAAEKRISLLQRAVANQSKMAVPGADDTPDTVIAEIELSLLEMIPEDQDTSNLDEQLDRLRATVASVLKHAPSSSSPASTHSSSSASTTASSTSAADSSSRALLPMGDLDENQVLQSLKTRLIDLEKFHFLHHCSWRDLCVASLLRN